MALSQVGEDENVETGTAPSPPLEDPNDRSIDHLKEDVTDADDVEVEEPNPLDPKPSDQQLEFQRQEYELNQYLQENAPKPKFSIKEMLKRMPGFDKIAQIKPTLGGSSGARNPKAFINLDEGDEKGPKKLPKGIESLMERFVKHVAPPVTDEDAKPHHYKLHVNKVEKDSQGQLHAVVDEIDYTSTPDQEEVDDDLVRLTKPVISSPVCTTRERVPGEKLYRLKQVLRERIKMNKAKVYEETAKLHAMYNEEKDLDDKEEEEDGELPEDEVVEEDDDDVTDSEEEEEIDEEEYPKVKEKKKRKRIIFIDDEAEDEDADAESSDSDGESDNRNSSDDDDGDGDEIDGSPEDKADAEVESSVSNSSQSQSLKTCEFPENEAVGEGDGDKEFETETANPVEDLMLKAGHDVSIEIEEMSGLISGRFPSQAIATPVESQYCFGFDDVEDDDDIETAETSNGDLNESCLSEGSQLQQSQSQQQQSQSEHPEESLLEESQSEGLTSEEAEPSSMQSNATSTSTPCPSAPADTVSTPLVGNVHLNADTPTNTTATPAIETPKMMDGGGGAIRRRSLGKALALEAENSKSITDALVTTKLAISKISVNNTTASVGRRIIDSDDEEGTEATQLPQKGKMKKKKRRLQFSDDEDDEPEKNGDDDGEDDAPSDEELSQNEEDDEDDEDEEAQYEQELIRKREEAVAAAQKPKGLFGKDGRLRKKFVEDEAELSGSEEGSGDEDEGGLNFYENEAGDDDDLDEEEVRKQVERAHLKHMLDSDDQRIRDLQNQYLERGDLESGKQRERKFKWGGLNEEWGADQAVGSDGECEEETEEEMKKKLADIERRKWISENSEALEANEEESQKMLFETSKFLRLGKSTMKKIGSLVESSHSFTMNETSSNANVTTTSTTCMDSSFACLLKSTILATSKPKTSLNNTGDESDGIKAAGNAQSQLLFDSPEDRPFKFSRGSFLSRGSPSLTRLAELTKVHDPTTNVKTNSRNFVFSTVTPPDSSDKANKLMKRPANNQGGQPRKFVKVDRSFSTLDESSKDNSVFKWF